MATDVPLLKGGPDYEARLFDKNGIKVYPDRQVVDEETRLRINGESKEQMAHARNIKAAGGVSLNPEDGNDTSKDSEWQYDNSDQAIFADRYVLVTTGLWFLVKLPIMAPFMLAFHILPMSACRLYMSSLPDQTQRLARSWYFYCTFAWVTILASPVIVLVSISLLLDYTVYTFFSLLYCLCTCRWTKAFESRSKIDPYRNGPSLLTHLPDLFACLIGQCARQTMCETLYMVSCMWLIMPWLKYYINCNPWIYDLDHRLCQQITTSMQDCGTPQEVSSTARDIISQCRQNRAMAEAIDIWSFVPHYPYPPLDRRWAIGLQAGGATYPGKFTLVVHVTHAVTEAKGSMEQFVLSNSVAEPIYRVMLWYSNPFHFFTGWVEASVSTGLPSQPNKHHGGEHPMWLVTGRSPLVAGRESLTGSGMIDAFFDYWLPVFVYEMRVLTQLKTGASLEDAYKYAEDQYEEVESKDGISAPTGKIGREKYSGEDTLSEFKRTAKDQHDQVSHKFGRALADAAETDLGKTVAALKQSRDLHDTGGCLEGCI